MHIARISHLTEGLPRRLKAASCSSLSSVSRGQGLCRGTMLNMNNLPPPQEKKQQLLGLSSAGADRVIWLVVNTAPMRIACISKCCHLRDVLPTPKAESVCAIKRKEHVHNTVTAVEILQPLWVRKAPFFFFQPLPQNERVSTWNRCFSARLSCVQPNSSFPLSVFRAATCTTV